MGIGLTQDTRLSSISNSTTNNMKNLRRKFVRAFNQLVSATKPHHNNTDKESIWNERKRKWQTIKRAMPSVPSNTRQKWVQLAGHQDSFAVGEEGTILKKLQENEKGVLEKLMSDALRPFVPKYNGVVTVETDQYIEMQDLLQGFTEPCIMDCKMGTRTYLEEELIKLEKKPEPRKDMYQKMIKVDPSEPTEEEHNAGAVTKPRYMQWRERISSSETLGFRIEGIKNSEGKAFVDFKNCKDKESIKNSFQQFCELQDNIIAQYIERLKSLRETVCQSQFFSTHEIIGSSLLFVHDRTQASVWMIDFGKATALPDGQEITHTHCWERGNHEDGYLTGVNNIIEILEAILKARA